MTVIAFLLLIFRSLFSNDTAHPYHYLEILVKKIKLPGLRDAGLIGLEWAQLAVLNKHV